MQVYLYFLKRHDAPIKRRSYQLLSKVTANGLFPVKNIELLGLGLQMRRSWGSIQQQHTVLNINCVPSVIVSFTLGMWGHVPTMFQHKVTFLLSVT